MATVSNNPQPYDSYSIGSQNADGKKKTEKKGVDSKEQLKEILEKLLRTYEKGKQDLWKKILAASSDSSKELTSQIQNNPGSAPSVPDVARDGSAITKDIENFFMLIFKFLADHKEGESKMEISQAVNTQGKEKLLDSVTKATLDSVANMKSQIEEAYKKAHSPLAEFLKIGLPIILAVVGIAAALLTGGGSMAAVAAADTALVAAEAGGEAAAVATTTATAEATAATTAAAAGDVAGASAGATAAEGAATAAESAAADAEAAASQAAQAAAKGGGEAAQTLAQAARQTADAAKTLATVARTAATAARTAATAASEAASGATDAATAATTIEASQATVAEAADTAMTTIEESDSAVDSTLEGVSRGSQFGKASTFNQIRAQEGVWNTIKGVASAVKTPGMIGMTFAGAAIATGTTCANEQQADETNSDNAATQIEQGEVAVNTSASQSLQTDINGNMQYQQNEMNEQQADDSQTQTILQNQATMFTIGSFNA